MKRFLTLLATGAFALGLSTAANAQLTRGIAAQGLILDDNAGHTITVQTPTSGQAYTDWQNAGFPSFTWTAPIPPPGNPSSGFVLSGPLLPTAPVYPTTRQLLYWVYPNQV